MSGNRLCMHVEKGDTVDNAVKEFNECWPAFANYGTVKVEATGDSTISEKDGGPYNTWASGSKWKVILGQPGLAGVPGAGVVPTTVSQTEMTTLLAMKDLEHKLDKMQDAKSAGISPRMWRVLEMVAVKELNLSDTDISKNATLGNLGEETNSTLEKKDIKLPTAAELNDVEAAMVELLKVLPSEKVAKMMNALAKNPANADTLLSLI